MEKTIHFLGGLPRSGNTLLAALLNQNPLIYCSPNSTLLENISGTISSMESPFNVRNPENLYRAKNVLNNFAKNFYADINEPIIFDRHKYWGTVNNIDMIKRRINENPKFIVTVRSITEILASFINLDGDRFFQEAFAYEGYPREYMQRNDRICDYLMRINGPIDAAMLAIAPAFNEEYSHMFHVVEYNQLISNPQEVMRGIYKFLDIFPFEHDFNNIKKREYDNDKFVGIHPDTHLVHSKITPSLTNPKEVLSEYAIKKYSGMDFWSKNATMKIRKSDWIKVG